MRHLRLASITALGSVLAFGLTVWAFPATSDYRGDNLFWNGTTNLVSSLDARLVSSSADLPIDARESTLILIPSVEVDSQALGHLRAYVESGGSVVVADDWGEGNQVLEALGIPARFSGDLLIDPFFNVGDRRFPLVADIEPSILTEGVGSIALNYATTLIGDGLDVVASSSVFSYLDVDGDGAHDSDEPTGPFPVVALVQIGAGRVLLLSDPSALTNAMLASGDNQILIENFVALSSPNARLFLDQRFLPWSRLSEGKRWLALARTVVSQPVTLVAAVLFFAIIMGAPRWRQKANATWNDPT